MVTFFMYSWHKKFLWNSTWHQAAYEYNNNCNCLNSLLSLYYAIQSDQLFVYPRYSWGEWQPPTYPPVYQQLFLNTISGVKSYLFERESAKC